MIQVFTHGGDAIMTTVTGPQHLEVIDRDGRIPQVCTMAVFTDVGGSDMVHRLAGGRHAVMTVATALGRDVLVIKVRR